MKTSQLEKTNEEMYDEAVKYLEVKARASGEFEQKNWKPLPELFYGNGKEQSVKKIRQIFDLERRSIVELRNLQDYSFLRTMSAKNVGFQKDMLLDCFQDILTYVIDEVIEQKDPITYELLMKKYE